VSEPTLIELSKSYKASSSILDKGDLQLFSYGSTTLKSKIRLCAFFKDAPLRRSGASIFKRKVVPKAIPPVDVLLIYLVSFSLDKSLKLVTSNFVMLFISSLFFKYSTRGLPVRSESRSCLALARASILLNRLFLDGDRDSIP
jgi:hypothetical protein